MKNVFILQNQHQAFLNKHSEWVDGRDANVLFRTQHKDEAINQMVEVSSRDYTQRVHLLECEVNDRNNPIIADQHLPPLSPIREADAPATGSEQFTDEAADGAETQPPAINQPVAATVVET